MRAFARVSVLARLLTFARIRPKCGADAGLLRPARRIHQVSYAFLGADEHIPRKFAIPQDLIIDGSFHADIQRETGEVLQPQVAVAIDLGAGEPWLQIGTLAGVRAEQRRDR